MALFGGWRERVGFLPHAVDVFEHGEREGVLYLRWRPGRTVDGKWRSSGAWKYRSLKVDFADLIARKFAKLPPGRARKEAEAWARAEAQAQVDRNRGLLSDPEPVPAPVPAPAPADAVDPARLTLAQGWALASDPESGKYPGADSARAHAGRKRGGRAAKLPIPKMHRRVAVAIQQAMDVWGADQVLAALRPSDFVKLLRRRVDAVRSSERAAARRPDAGLGAAIGTVRLVLGVFDWLREERHLGRGDALPAKHWRVQAAQDYAARHTNGVAPKVQRPRYTIEEVHRLFAAARAGEPRVALLIAVGAELRPGQVLRCTRRGLTLPLVDWTAPVPTPDATDYGTLVVEGAGKKGGETVHLTRGQRLEVDRALGYLDPAAGYLRLLEAAHVAGTLPDYPLFPGEKIARVRGERVATVARHAHAAPLHPDNARKHFRAIEAVAEVSAVRGRSFYGIRRATVDAAVDLKLDPGVLSRLGGWTDERTPREIYKDRESATERRKAREARAQIRGETSPATTRAPE